MLYILLARTERLSPHFWQKFSHRDQLRKLKGSLEAYTRESSSFFGSKPEAACYACFWELVLYSLSSLTICCMLVFRHC